MRDTPPTSGPVVVVGHGGDLHPAGLDDPAKHGSRLLGVRVAGTPEQLLRSHDTRIVEFLAAEGAEAGEPVDYPQQANAGEAS